jgi:hypothetical protein
MFSANPAVKSFSQPAKIGCFIYLLNRKEEIQGNHQRDSLRLAQMVLDTRNSLRT